MKLYKFVKQGRGGVLGSLANKVAYPETPITVYEPGKDTYPEYGHLMCYGSVREGHSFLEQPGYQLWLVDADVVDVDVPRIVGPSMFPYRWEIVKRFWRNYARFLETEPWHHTVPTPPRTVFCSRVRLVEFIG